ncbi:MAG: glycosyltransferase [Pseudomonadota bacterium]|nr:glycosyltransferase [Pseudomonadota bacterium]
MGSPALASRKIRILHVTHDLDLGGLQQVIVSLCRTIDRSAYEPSVLCLRSGGMFVREVEALGIGVHVLEKVEGRADYLKFLKIRRFLAAHPQDVVHTHNTEPFIDGTIAAMMTRGAMVVHTDHARHFPDKLRYMIAERIVSTFAYRVVGCSEHTTKALARHVRIPRRKLRTIPNGIDGSRFENLPDRSAARAAFGVGGFRDIIGLGVRLSDQKGITYLIRAMPQILSRAPETALLVAGDGPLRGDLEREAASLGVARNVIFCGTLTDIPLFLAALDVYTLPSMWEGLPMAVLEAMAAGLPVVATDVGGTGTAVADGVTGILLPPRDVDALGSAIAGLLESPELRHRMGESGRQRFREHFKAEIMTRSYERLYRRQDI